MTKEKVLEILHSSKNYVSGEKMSNILNISRAAINKAVKSLREEGYEIDSVNNRGYKLLFSPGNLTRGELMAYLSPERMEKVVCFESINSTNLKLSELAVSGAEDSMTVIANEQTRGRGRRGRSFSSPKDKGLYLSYLMRRSETPKDVTGITAWAAVAVERAIENVIGIQAKEEGRDPGALPDVLIKWVNDIIINSKKVCGILTELSMEGESRYVNSLIIGIGININEEKEDFSEDIRELASSLFLETGMKINRARLAAKIIEELDGLNRAFPDKPELYLRDYRDHSLVTGKEIFVYDNIELSDGRKATALKINDDFSLNVRFEDTGEITDLSSGEVSIRPM